MKFNYKLYLKCILHNSKFSFINNEISNDNVYNLLIGSNALYYLALHFRFSSLFYSSQLVDIFSYELPTTGKSFKNENFKKNESSIVLYNFHLLNTNNKFFVFTKTPSKNYSIDTIIKDNSFSSIFSITELFFAANWLEREISELNGIFFTGKKDIRNLMLQYGDSSSPFQKSFPTIGLKEMYYNPIKDTIIQNPVTIQI